MINTIFVNMPVAQLSRSVEFFSGLGFTFNPQFTDEESTCMVISDTIYVMLLEHSKFTGFTNRPLNAKGSSEAIFTFGCESSEEVKALTQKAFELGAKKVNEPSDLGFMFSWGFEDLDGHLWELFWMNPDYLEQEG